MNQGLVPIMEPLVITELSLCEQDFFECQKALLGKGVTFLYTVVSVCCASVIGICAVAEQIGIASPEQTKMYLTVMRGIPAPPFLMRYSTKMGLASTHTLQ